MLEVSFFYETHEDEVHGSAFVIDVWVIAVDHFQYQVCMCVEEFVDCREVAVLQVSGSHFDGSAIFCCFVA